MKAYVALLAVLAMFGCSDATGDAGSTGSLAGTVTDTEEAAVTGARVVVSSEDGSIVPQLASGVLTDDDGRFRVDLLSEVYSQRKTQGQVDVTPPDGSSLAEKVIAGVVLETGPGAPETQLDVILDER